LGVGRDSARDEEGVGVPGDVTTGSGVVVTGLAESLAHRRAGPGAAGTFATPPWRADMKTTATETITEIASTTRTMNGEIKEAGDPLANRLPPEDRKMSHPSRMGSVIRLKPGAV
jgi:hypothetical protein